jgi:hypothetical protein
MIEYTVKVHPDRTEWFLNGKLHREDGPAVEWADGSRSWWLNDQRHRTDGPAVEHADGDREWWLNGEQVTEAEVMKPSKELTVAQIEQLLGYSVKVVK